MRKGETGNRPSEIPTESKFPELLKANRIIGVHIGFVILYLILFGVVGLLPLTAHGFAFMMLLLFAALSSLFLMCFQILELHQENNFRIQNWLSMEGLRSYAELAKLNSVAINAVAQGTKLIAEYIKKSQESPGNHPSKNNL